MSDELSIRTVNLHKEFGSFIALSDLTMNVRKNEFMGLLGPNGAGKSTTLKLLTGLIKPTSGEAYVNGFDAVRDHRQAMADVGCVIETPDYYEAFTPADTLEYIGRLRGMSTADIQLRGREVLEELKIWDWRNKKISSFSKGMKQRVSLAQALMPDPSLLILDEPTSGLDPRGMIEMRQTLAGLKKFDVSLLISTHILKEVSEICESVTMIRNGKCMVSGNVTDLIKSNAGKTGTSLSFRTIRPMNAVFVKNFSGCAGVKSTMTMGANEIKVEFAGTLEQQADLIDMIQKNNLRLVSMSEKTGDIENLYMELTKDEASVA